MKALRTRAEAPPEKAWQQLERLPPYVPLTNQTRERPQPHEKERIVAERGYLNLRLNFEEVAEFEYQPSKCRRAYRVVVLRKNISRIKGENVLFDEIDRKSVV